MNEQLVEEFKSLIKVLERIVRIYDGMVEAPSSPLIPPKVKPFPELKPKSYVEITGEVTDNPEVKEVDTRSGPSMIANFHITDGQNSVRVALWGDLSSEAGGLRIGDTITLTNMSVKDPYEGTDQISSTRNTTLKRD